MAEKSKDTPKGNEGIIIVIYSYAKGNFINIRNINRFLDTLKIYAVVENKIIDETEPPIIIEINVLDESQRFIVSKIKNYATKSSIENMKVTVKDSDMPTFGDMAKSFGTALFQTGLDLVTGKTIMASEEVQKQRLDTCKNCDAFNHTSYTCTRCNCKMVYKSVLQSSVCPLDKWAE